MRIDEIGWADGTLIGFAFANGNMEIQVELWDERRVVIDAKDSIHCAFTSRVGDLAGILEVAPPDSLLANFNEESTTFRMISLIDDSDDIILQVVASEFSVRVPGE